jgi:polyphosphate glucokinase
MDTPHPATPEAVTAMIVNVVSAVAAEHELPAELPVGCGLPGVVKDGRMLTAANLDKRWIGLNVEEFIGAALGRRVHAVNDADAAAIAEVRIGAGREFHGTILLLTVGTGIGSGLLFDGWLVPNTEFGHIEIKGKDAEGQLSGAARERRRLRWKAWALEFNTYLARLEAYVWPDLIILGGGVSKVIRRYREWLKSRAPIVSAQFLNTAGIIGAAMTAADREAPPVRRQAWGTSGSKVTVSVEPKAVAPSKGAKKAAAPSKGAKKGAAPSKAAASS